MAKLSFHTDTPNQYPQGYWYASTDDDGYDADGATQVEALIKLVSVLEEILKETE